MLALGYRAWRPQMLALGHGAQPPNVGVGAQGTDPKWWHWDMGQGPPSAGTGVRATETPNGGTGAQDMDSKWWPWDIGHVDPKCWP